MNTHSMDWHTQQKIAKHRKELHTEYIGKGTLVLTTYTTLPGFWTATTCQINGDGIVTFLLVKVPEARYGLE